MAKLQSIKVCRFVLVVKVGRRLSSFYTIWWSLLLYLGLQLDKLLLGFILDYWTLECNEKLKLCLLLRLDKLQELLIHLIIHFNDVSLVAYELR